MGRVSEVDRSVLSGSELRRKELRDRAREHGGNLGARLGKGLAHVIVDFGSPTFIATPYSKVNAIEGKFSRGIAKALSETAKVLETSGAILVAFGAVVWAPPILVAGAGMYVAGRVPGEISEKFTNWRLRSESKRRRTR